MWIEAGVGLMLGMLVALGSVSVVAGEISPMESGLRNYALENYEEALEDFLKVREELARPKPKRSGAIGLELLGAENLPIAKDQSEVVRLLGLTYFQLQRFDDAARELYAILEYFQRDESILFALAEIELASGNPRRALDHLQLLKQMVSYKPEVRYLEGRALVALGQDYDAIEALQRAIELSPAARAKVTLPLAQAYVRTGRTDNARHLLADDMAKDAIGMDRRRDQVLLAQLKRVKKPFATQVGMRLESDSNVVLESSKAEVNTGTSGKSDTRTVFLGDLVYQQEFNQNVMLFHEGHFYYSKHQELSQFDELRLNYILSPGYSTARWGARFPVGITWNQLDGHDYLTSLSSTPGAYLRVNNDLSVMGYMRADINDYQEKFSGPAERRAEDRSGSYRGLGFLSLWYFKDRDGELRFKLDRGDNTTDGNNWTRAETVMLLDTDYQATPLLKVSGGLVKTGHDYSNTHSVYAVKRSDSALQISAAVQYLAQKEWEYEARYSTVTWDSNIDVYSYQRNILMLSVIWRREARSND